MIFTSTGTLRYSPKLIGDQPQSPNWWLVLDCDPEIGKYFRHLYLLDHYRCKTLRRPAWDSHITVIRNEEPDDKHKPMWNRFAGCKVQFQVIFNPRTNGEYCWLPIQSDFLLDLRQDFGLSRHPHYPLHLSIGHTDLNNH